MSTYAAQNGPAVNLTIDAGGPALASGAGYLVVAKFGSAGEGTVYIPNQLAPTAGNSITANGVTLTNTGATAVAAGGSGPALPVFSVSVDATVPPLANPNLSTSGYGLFYQPLSGYGGEPCTAVFGVTAAPPQNLTSAYVY
jgi:hypothetical protein